MSWIGKVFRYAISFIACAALLWWIDWTVFLQTIELANWYWLVAVLAVILGDRAFMVYKWMILLRSSGVAVSWGMAFRAYFVGAFAEAFLPASIGGDVMRVTWLTYRIANSGKIISSVVVERLLGALALALVAVASFVLFARHLAGTSPELTVAIVAILSISLVGTAVIFSRRAHKAMKKVITAIPFRGLEEMAEKARVAVLEFRGSLHSSAFSCYSRSVNRLSRSWRILCSQKPFPSICPWNGRRLGCRSLWRWLGCRFQSLAGESRKGYTDSYLPMLAFQ